MRHQPVKDWAALRILVQTQVEKVPQKPPALRGAKPIGAPQRPGAGIVGRGRAIAQKRDHISDRQESAADDASPGGRVDNLVDLARLESSWHVDVLRVGNDLSPVTAGKGPGLARNRPTKRLLVIANDQDRLGIIQVGDRIRLVLPV